MLAAPPGAWPLQARSPTSISPNFVRTRSFFALAIHLRAVMNVPLHRIDPVLDPTPQRLASQQTHLLHNALFRSVRFLQFALVASNRQHDRGDPSIAPGPPPAKSEAALRVAAPLLAQLRAPTAV
jgi:hypothetical protein